MKRLMATLGMALLASSAFAKSDKADVVERFGDAAGVFRDIMAAPDKGIPQDLLRGAYCLGIIPGAKRGGFIVGAKYGKGVLMCRTGANRTWSGPSTVRIEGGSFGALIGVSETDIVFMVLNETGAEKLMGNKFTLGVDAAAAAGPVGREGQAKTDVQLRAQILSWSRSRGLFAGVSLDGATLRPDNDDNTAVYGKPVSHRDILMSRVPPPASAKVLYDAIGPYTTGAPRVQPTTTSSR